MVNNISREIEKLSETLGVDRKRSIGEVAKELKVKTHVIRFWEENFPQIKPEIGAGARRYYYNKQLKILRRIKKFLYEEGYTIAGLKKLLGRRHKDEAEKQNEEDLEILLHESKEVKQERSIEIDDFLGNENEIKINAALENKKENKNETRQNLAGSKVAPNSKILDFIDIEVPLIDPRIKQQINSKIEKIENNLEKLKKITSGIF